ncbi:MAG TPA: hypothetical protein VGJ05_03090 [Fimbriiglobus sp.]|jgi:hypothetical protein
MRFEVDGPAFAGEGDEVEIGDPIRRGDVVWFDRVEPHKLVMRVVAGPVSGQCFLIDKGSEPDVLRLVAVEPSPADPQPLADTALRDTALPLGTGAGAAGGGVHDDFPAFMQAVVLPRRAASPTDIRLDGATAGGSRGVAGRFRHHDRVWVVHEDTHYEPLALAYAAAQAGANPFVEEATARGRCLSLTPELRARQRSPHKYLYIYSWSPAGES